MFIAGMSGVLEVPYNDIWTVPGEENLREEWKKEDEDFFATIDATNWFFSRLIDDFSDAIRTGREPEYPEGTAGKP